MNPESWAIIGVGIAVLGLGWRAYESLRRDISDLKDHIGESNSVLPVLRAGSPAASGKKQPRPDPHPDYRYPLHVFLTSYRHTP